MRKIQRLEIISGNNPIIDKVFNERAAFFDIETTGFSAGSTSLYLIGCSFRDGDKIRMEQFFADAPSEENEVLSAFFEAIADIETLISFNGTGFDLPYLMAKCEKYNRSENLWDYKNIDIFKIVSKLKFLLGLKNYKQKSIEDFLGLWRDDKMNGGELIEVYRDYVKNPSDEALSLLLLHNYEDVLRMTDLLPMLSYSELFEGKYRVLSAETASYRAYDGSDGREFMITLKVPAPVPRPVSLKNDDGIYLKLEDDKAILRLPVFEGELRYFLPNYKDYYYLPAEDVAMHKSVAGFVDKEFRRPAKASTCYTKKSGIFLPQFNHINEPEFKKEYKDKMSYFEINDEFLCSDEKLKIYIDHILKHLKKNKKTPR
jgi:hypothetical protein